MPETYDILVFSAQNLQRGFTQPFGPDDTDAPRPNGAFRTGDETGQTITIVDDYDPALGGQDGDAIDTLDDGTDARQTLGEPVTLTFALPSGAVVTRTFPEGTQVQAEFTQAFRDGTEIVALRFENPLAGQPGEPDLITAGYTTIGAPPEPDTTIGQVRGGSDDGTTAAGALACLVAGAMVDTPEGPRAVEALAAGDLVETLDAGAQPLVWAGSRVVTPAEMMADPLRCGPVRLAGGPVLSPLHRVLRSDAGIALLTGMDEALVEARRLGRRTGWRRVTYHHLATREHHLIRVDGVWCETMLRGDFGDPLAAEGAAGGGRRACRPLLRGYEARVYAALVAQAA